MRAAFLALLSALLLAVDDGQKPHIAALAVTPTAGRIDISFVLENVFDEDLVERIQTGLATGFDFRIRLVRSQRWWWLDREVMSADFSVVTMYNAVTGEYLVNYKKDGKLIDSRVVREIRDLRDAMTRFEDLHALDTANLETDRSLWIRVRADLGSRHRLFIIPTTVQTDWADSRRFRLPELPR